MGDATPRPEVSLSDLRRCFEGRVPAVIATADAHGTPNVTYLSAVHPVDGERVALSNQFMSKTSRNVAENPWASVLLIDPLTYAEYRLTLQFERTERRGPVFEKLRSEVDQVAALSGMTDVFRLRAADIYRVSHIERVFAHPDDPACWEKKQAITASAVSELASRLDRCGDLDMLVEAAVKGLSELLGYRHSSLLLLDERGERLFTIASHGFAAQGIGSEVVVGHGVVGAAAQRCEPVRIGNLRQLAKYGRTIRKASALAEGGIDVPRLDDLESQLAVPAMAMGQLVGVIVVESNLPVAFGDEDQALLQMVGGLVANAIEGRRRAPDRAVVGLGGSGEAPTDVRRSGATTVVRFFSTDGSVFLDDEYLIRGVAGRLLWSLLSQHQASGRREFTTKELRLDPTLELPEYRDNLDTRLILLKRRLDEREARIRLERVGRGRYSLDVDGLVRLTAT